jgi:hypothetical protein
MEVCKFSRWRVKLQDLSSASVQMCPCSKAYAGQKQQKFALNSADKVYLELRDLSFAAVGPKLSERAKSLQTDYKGSKGSERSLAELKDFAAQLKSLPNITRHINLAEAINRVIARQNFRDRVTVEQSLLDGHSVDACCETIEVILSSAVPSVESSLQSAYIQGRLVAYCMFTAPATMPELHTGSVVSTVKCRTCLLYNTTQACMVESCFLEQYKCIYTHCSI